jgi:hypothetical protein
VFHVINLKAQYEPCSCNIDHGRRQKFWRLNEVNNTLLLCCKFSGVSFISFSYLLFYISKYLMLLFFLCYKGICHFSLSFFTIEMHKGVLLFIFIWPSKASATTHLVCFPSFSKVFLYSSFMESIRFFDFETYINEEGGYKCY